MKKKTTIIVENDVEHTVVFAFADGARVEVTLEGARLVINQFKADGDVTSRQDVAKK